MMSRRRTRPSTSSSRQMMIAWKVSGLSHSPAIIASRPASMRLAMAISPSRERSSTEPISRKYMRTGSSVRSIGSAFAVSALTTGWAHAVFYSITSRRSAHPEDFKADMVTLFDLLRDRAIHPVVIDRLPLAAARDVHTRIDLGGLGGK